MAALRWPRGAVALATGAVIVLAVGCASVPQRQAFEQLKVAEQTPQIVQRHAYSRPALPELTASATLPDYLAYAALNNPQLEAAFNRWKAALENVPQARTLPDPRFNYRYFIQEVETRVGPQMQGFGIGQLFPWFGKLTLRGEAALEAANAVQQQYEAAKLKLFDDVKQA